MKTSVVMIRPMGSFEVHQRTKDGMFNANSLLKQWNASGGSKKEIKDYFDNKSTKEFIEAMINDENTIGGIVPMIKSKASKGENAGTWMHPYLFIDFAMWLNPKFKLEVIKFVYDELIKYRNDAGDGYLQLSASGVKLKGYSFTEVATNIQWIVYNHTGKNLRQISSQEQLKEINDIQTKLSFAIDMGYIKTYNQLLGSMRDMYRMKYSKQPF
jgi:uncharacterized protein YjgD (DUF1641 family)